MGQRWSAHLVHGLPIWPISCGLPIWPISCGLHVPMGQPDPYFKMYFFYKKDAMNNNTTTYHIILNRNISHKLSSIE